MPMTLTDAAKACGRDKSTLRRAIKSGLISGTRDAFGVWMVEPAELHRIYPPAELTSGTDHGEPRHAAADTAATDALVAELRAVIADLRQGRDAVIADLRADRDHWRDQAQRLALPKPAAATAAQMSWWQWLRTTA